MVTERGCCWWPQERSESLRVMKENKPTKETLCALPSLEHREGCDRTRRSLSYRTSLECEKTILDGRFPDVSNTLFCLLSMQGPHVLDQTFSPFCQGLKKIVFLGALAWPEECTQSNSKLLRNETLGGMTPEDWNKAGAPCAQHSHAAMGTCDYRHNIHKNLPATSRRHSRASREDDWSNEKKRTSTSPPSDNHMLRIRATGNLLLVNIDIRH